MAQRLGTACRYVYVPAHYVLVMQVLVLERPTLHLLCYMLEMPFEAGKVKLKDIK